MAGTLSNEQVQELAEKRLNGTISPEENTLLEDWFSRDPGTQMLWEGEDTDLEALRNRLYLSIQNDLRSIQDDLQVMPRLFLKRRWVWAAAAVLLLIVGAGIFIFRPQPERTAVAAGRTLPAPDGKKAMLTLADGRQLALDQTANGSVAEQNGVKIVKEDSGRIAYEATGYSNGPAVYNTLTIPRGGIYVIRLPDGSRVWLNSASSLKYPTRFSNKERIVYLTGEGYFEVAKNDRQPFIVQTGGQTIQVLGTDFNVMSYEDEDKTRTTLFQGAVKVITRTDSKMLQPGQQTVFDPNTHDLAVSTPDLEQVLAWKNGLFLFHQASLPEIGRQIGRWYDVDLAYEGDVSGVHLSGSIARKENAAQLMEILEETGKVKFRLTGRQLTVIAIDKK